MSSAQGNYSNRAEAFLGEVYLGVKYGRITYSDEVPDFSDGSDTRNFGFMFGKRFNDVVGMELEYTQTVTADDTSVGDVFTDTLGFYVVGKFGGKVYGKGRLGYTRLTQERNFAGDSFDHNSYGIAYGLGVGFTFYEKGSVEIEYTVLPKTDDRRFLNVPAGQEFEAEGDLVTLNYVWGF